MARCITDVEVRIHPNTVFISSRFSFSVVTDTTTSLSSWNGLWICYIDNVVTYIIHAQ